MCSLTLTHELDGAPVLASIVGGRWEDQGAGGGHTWVLNDLKTLLETGSSFARDPARPSRVPRRDGSPRAVPPGVPSAVGSPATAIHGPEIRLQPTGWK